MLSVGRGQLDSSSLVVCEKCTFIPGLEIISLAPVKPIITQRPGALTIYTIHPGGNFWYKYSAMQLVQTENGKIAKCTSINWEAQKEKRKRIY